MTEVLTVRPTPEQYVWTFGGAAPLHRIKPGTILEVFTEDCFAGRVRSERDLVSEVCEFPYLNPQTGHEFSAVAGLTHNYINPYTIYQNGLDFHLDWGASQFLSKQFFIGLVGYAYDQVSADSGAGDRVGASAI